MSETPPPDEHEHPRRVARVDIQQHVIMSSVAVAIYLSVLWFGVTVVGDTLMRSTMMAVLILILAGMAYLTSRQHPPEQ